MKKSTKRTTIPRPPLSYKSRKEKKAPAKKLAVGGPYLNIDPYNPQGLNPNEITAGASQGRMSLSGQGQQAYDRSTNINNAGSVAYGVLEGTLDGLSFGLTDGLTDKGYDALQASNKGLTQTQKDQGERWQVAGQVGGAALSAYLNPSTIGTSIGTTDWGNLANESSEGTQQLINAGAKVIGTAYGASGFGGGEAGAMNMGNSAFGQGLGNLSTQAQGMSQYGQTDGAMGNLMNTYAPNLGEIKSNFNTFQSTNPDAGFIDFIKQDPELLNKFLQQIGATNMLPQSQGNPQTLAAGGQVPQGGPVPTQSDSLALYNNALAKNAFYAANPDYESRPSVTDFTNRFVRQDLINNNRSMPMDQRVIDGFNADPRYLNENRNMQLPNSNLHQFGDILAGQPDHWINPSAPPVLLHENIAPQGSQHYYSYKHGDGTEVPNYEPLAIKPWSAMTSYQEMLDRINKHGVSGTPFSNKQEALSFLSQQTSSYLNRPTTPNNRNASNMQPMDTISPRNSKDTMKRGLLQKEFLANMQTKSGNNFSQFIDLNPNYKKTPNSPGQTRQTYNSEQPGYNVAPHLYGNTGIVPGTESYGEPIRHTYASFAAGGPNSVSKKKSYTKYLTRI